MKGLLRIFILIVQFIGAVLAAELTLWLCDFPQWWAPDALVRMPHYVEPDREAGWLPKPGVYDLYDPLTKRALTLTINNDRARASGDSHTSTARLVFLGDSYVLGYGLSDAETFPWKVQQRLSQFEVSNLGVGGYGTCHSVQRMRSLLRRTDYPAPQRVVYLFNSFHVERNIGAPLSVYVAELSGQSDYTTCTLHTSPTSEVLIQMEPLNARWKVSSMLRSAAPLEEVTRAVRYRLKEDYAVSATKALLAQFAAELQKAGIEFQVVLFEVREPAAYIEDFIARGISYIDCTSLVENHPEQRLADGHPDASMNTRLANCIADALLAQSYSSSKLP